jgi:hypothetical protein
VILGEDETSHSVIIVPNQLLKNNPYITGNIVKRVENHEAMSYFTLKINYQYGSTRYFYLSKLKYDTKNKVWGIIGGNVN